MYNWVQVTTTLLLAEDLVDNIIRPDSVDIHIFKMSLHFLPILHYQAKQAPVCLHVLITWDMGIPPT
ncbi:hypothetical protein BDA96_06G111400 [Sorghum bicolor]|uniref:Uncharacterized protein n=1 Tax=Sorghum bicolor TaxID=4558 RepID=A0A921UD07_SORBI|nr:hypothetical protein BDA96_06G111400 [Sorghum bicolor]